MIFKLPQSGQAVRFSPFLPTRIAVASSQNFGIVGNGRVHVLDIGPTADPNIQPPTPPAFHGITEVQFFDTLDAVVDVCWSESNENLLLAACGDGACRLYDTAAPPLANPVRAFAEHTHEAVSASWNQVRRDSFVSASWDDTVKLWDPNRPTSLATFRAHQYCVYQAVWNPQSADVFLTVSGDRTLCIWDIRTGGPAGPTPGLQLPAHASEILTGDWCKYDDTIVATGSTDKTIKIWDLRAINAPISVLSDHQLAVKRVQFSPFTAHVLASCSYDMTVRLWDQGPAPPVPNPSGRVVPAACRHVMGHHTEFAVDIDWSVLQPGQLATTGWDQTVHVTSAMV